MKLVQKRVRPADGGVKWHEELHAFECYGCSGFEEVRNRADREPEKLALLRELMVLDHAECWKFDDPRQAADARKYRKEKTRRRNLGEANRGGMAAQRVAWRGR